MIIIGHRGAAAYKPENTLVSFKKAIQLKVDMIEFDVQLCKSGDAIVFHDDSLDRCTNSTGLISQKTLEELKKVDAGDGELIPTLEETLTTINRKSKVNIELKSKSTAEEVSRIIKKSIKNDNWKPTDFLVSSFHHEELIKFRSLMDDIRIGILYEHIPTNFFELAVQLNAYSINSNYKNITRHNVEEVHNHLYKIYAYTVNSKEDKTIMKEIGVDGIFTDYP